MKNKHFGIIITLLLVILICMGIVAGVLWKRMSDKASASENIVAAQSTETTETETQTTVTETTETTAAATTETETTQPATTETATTEPESTVDVSMYDNPTDRFLYSITDIDSMILVIGDGYTINSAVLYYYEKIDGEWVCELSVDAWCGSRGFSNSTYEGDHTTPVGLFELGLAFGNYPNPGTELEWVDVNEHLYWVDDNTSEYYDQLIDDREVPDDAWNSGEHLIEYGDYYGYSIYIAVNPPYETSAIFLHNDGGGTGTAGCVGIPSDSMRWILQNIKTDTRIAIVENEDDLDHINELRER